MARANNNRKGKVNKISKYKQTTAKAPALLWIVVGIAVLIIALLVAFSIPNAQKRLVDEYNKLETPVSLPKDHALVKVDFDEFEKNLESGNAVVLYIGGKWMSTTTTGDVSILSLNTYFSEDYLKYDSVTETWDGPVMHDAVDSILYLETKDLEEYEDIIHRLSEEFGVPYNFTASNPTLGWKDEPQVLTFYNKAYVNGLFEISGATPKAEVRDLFVELYEMLPDGYKPANVGFPTWGIVLIVVGGVLLVVGAGVTTILIVRRKRNA